MKNVMKININSSTTQAINDVNARFKRYEDLIKFTVYNPTIKTTINAGDEINFYIIEDINDYVEPILYNILLTNKDVIDFEIYNDTGRPRMGDFVKAKKEVEEEAWYQISVRNNGTSWWYEEDELFLTRTIVDIPLNKKIGLIKLTVDKKAIFEELMKDTFYDTGFVMVDQNGKVLHSKPLEGHEGRGVEDVLLNRLMGDSKRYIQYEGQEYYTVEKEIPLSGWVVYYYTSTQDLQRNVGVLAEGLLVIVVVCMLLVGIIILLFSYTFVRRIDKLNRKMKQVEKGNLEISITTKSEDEIGQLANRFNKMVKEINRLIEEVYQARIVQKETKLKVLQSQINPHFLYNSLSTINWRAIRINEPEISRVTQLLSKFYRTSLNRGLDLILIKDEIENIQSYIEMQLIMREVKFDIVYEINESILTYRTINFILQPIVENAIEHGVESLREGKGLIKVTGTLIGQDIQFTVEDNGQGISQEVIGQLLYKEAKGYGLKNVHERIVLAYGAGYGVEIEEGRTSGTVIRLKFPVSNYCQLNKEEIQKQS